MAAGVRLEDWELEGKVVAGIDTHLDTNWLCVPGERGRISVSEEFSTKKEGCEALADAIGDPERCAAVGVEGTCSYGAGVTDVLVARGFTVFEVLRPKRETRRMPGEGKDDAIDAARAARDVLAGHGTSVPKLRGGWVDELRALDVARDSCVKSKVEAHATALSLTVTAPDDERRKWEGMSQDKMMKAMLQIDEGEATALERSLLALARAWDACSREANDLEKDMKALLEANCPSILELYGFGTVNGAAMVISAGENPERFPTEAKFAKHCGVAPIPASTGKTSGKTRLNRGGDRKANRALHNAVVTRMKNDERTKAYIEKKTKNPRTTKKDAERCLARFVCREAYHALLHPFGVPQKLKRQALREARLMAGLTQKQVAAVLGVSPSSVSGVESGRVKRSKAVELYTQWVEDGMPMDVENSSAPVEKTDGKEPEIIQNLA